MAKKLFCNIKKEAAISGVKMGTVLFFVHIQYICCTTPNCSPCILFAFLQARLGALQTAGLCLFPPVDIDGIAEGDTFFIQCFFTRP